MSLHLASDVKGRHTGKPVRMDMAGPQGHCSWWVQCSPAGHYINIPTCKHSKHSIACKDMRAKVFSKYHGWNWGDLEPHNVLWCVLQHEVELLWWNVKDRTLSCLRRTTFCPPDHIEPICFCPSDLMWIIEPIHQLDFLVKLTSSLKPKLELQLKIECNPRVQSKAKTRQPVPHLG